MQELPLRLAAAFDDADAVLDALNAGAQAVVLPGSTPRAVLELLPISRVRLSLEATVPPAQALALAELCCGFSLDARTGVDVAVLRELKKALPSGLELSVLLPTTANPPMIAELDAAGFKSEVSRCWQGHA